MSKTSFSLRKNYANIGEYRGEYLIEWDVDDETFPTSCKKLRLDQYKIAMHHMILATFKTALGNKSDVKRCHKSNRQADQRAEHMSSCVRILKFISCFTQN